MSPPQVDSSLRICKNPHTRAPLFHGCRTFFYPFSFLDTPACLIAAKTIPRVARPRFRDPVAGIRGPCRSDTGTLFNVPSSGVQREETRPGLSDTSTSLEDIFAEEIL